MNMDVLARFASDKRAVAAGALALILAAAPAISQAADAPGQRQEGAQQQEGGAAGADQTAQGGQADAQGSPGNKDLTDMTVGDLYDSEVINANDEQIGTVRDLVVDQRDQSLQVVIDVGGWLGIGGTQVAVPVEELEVRGEEQLAYLTEASKEQIQEQAEGYDARRYVPINGEDVQLSVFMNQPALP